MYPISINKGRTIIPMRDHVDLVERSPLSSLSLLVKSIEHEI